MSGLSTDTGTPVGEQTQLALVDLLDRVLAGGVVISGEIALAIADVDLVYVSLRALITSVRTGEEWLDVRGADG